MAGVQMSWTSRLPGDKESDETGLLTRRPHPGIHIFDVGIHCLGGAAAGLCLGTLAAMILPWVAYTMSGTDVLPTIVHREVLYLSMWTVCTMIGASAGGCATQRRRGRDCWCCRGHRLVSLIVIGMLSVLVASMVSSPARDELLTIIDLLAGSQWPPRGYCAAVAAADAARNASGEVWWRQWGSDPAEAAAALVGNMTFDERASLLSGEGYGPFGQRTGAFVGGTPAIPRLGLPSIRMQDAGQGFRTTHRSQVGTVTSWPCLLALAATWDRDAVRTVGAAIAREFVVKGANVLLGPAVNVHRVAANGRNAEYLSGEEPYLGAALTGEYVHGVQSVGVAAVVKHFVLNSQETDRMTTAAFASDRALHEVYYPPFAAAAEAGVAAVMCGYNRVNVSRTAAAYACGHPRTLARHLRRHLGFGGFVMSDWWALHSTGAASGGVDQNMPGTDGWFAPRRLHALPGPLLDAMATRVLRSMLSVGGLERSSCTAGCDCAPLMLAANATSVAHTALARQVAARSAILLKNERVQGGRRALPLQPGATLALIGSACDASHSIDPERSDWTDGDYYVVGGSGRVIAAHAVSIREGLARRGFRLRVSTSDRLDDALVAAEGSDAIIACGAGRTAEASDRPTLRLDQHDLLAALGERTASATASSTTASPFPPLIVAVMAPGAVATSPWAESASAVVALFLGGQESGHAWADVLSGFVNPSGKLPVTFPRTDADMVAPCVGSASHRCVYAEGLAVGWRGLIGRPVGFPFGYGLSYTTFALRWVAPPSLVGLPSAAAPYSPAVRMAVRVANVGDVSGAEVVQLYLAYPAAASEPPLVLRGFMRTHALAPGEAQTINLTLTARDLSIWQEGGHPRGSEHEADGGAWRIAGGTFGIVIGSHSRDQASVRANVDVRGDR